MANSTLRLESTQFLFVSYKGKPLAKTEHVAVSQRAHVMHECIRKRTLARLHVIQMKHKSIENFEQRSTKPRRKPRGKSTGSSPSLEGNKLIQRQTKRRQTRIKPVSYQHLNRPGRGRPGKNSTTSKPSQINTSDCHPSSSNTKLTATRRAHSRSRSATPKIETPRSSSISSRQIWRPASPTTYLNGGANDPFSSASIPIDHVSSGLIRFYLHDMPRHFIPLAGDGGATVRTCKEEVNQSLGSEELMFSLLAYIASMMKSLFPGALQPGSLETTGALTYGTRCVGLLQQRLRTPPSRIRESTISAVLHVALAELIEGNLDRNFIHLKGATEVVRAKGGLQALSPWILAVIMVIDTSSACLTTKIHFPHPFPVADLDDRTKQETAPTSKPDLMRLGSQLMKNEALFEKDLKCVFQQLRELIYLNMHTATLPGGMKDQDQAWVVYRFISIEHHLLMLTFPNGVKDSLEALQGACLYAVVLLCSTTLSILPMQRTRSAASNLLNLLLQSDLEAYWNPHQDILFWVLFIGLFIAETTEKEAWFIAKLAEVSTSLRLKEWEEAEDILLGFFYMGPIHEGPFRRLWGKVQQHQRIARPRLIGKSREV